MWSNQLRESDKVNFQSRLRRPFEGLYGFRNAGEGVGHGGADGGAATKELSEYALAVAPPK